VKIPERQAELDALIEEYLEHEEERKPVVEGLRPHSTVHLTDEEILGLLRRARNAPKVAALWRGDASQYDDDQSRADCALAEMIAFYTQDPEQIERIFNLSKPGERDKWRRRDDYRKRTIAKALSKLIETYKAPREVARKQGENEREEFDVKPSARSLRSEAFQRRAATQEGAAGDRLQGRVLLAKGIEEGIEPPEELEPDVLLKGRVHSLYAASGTGKTWFMLWLAKQCIERGESVLIFDMENGPRIVSERLRELGVPTERLDELLHYYSHPSLPLNDLGVAAYEALLDEVKPSLVIFDSWINFLASVGLDENASNDIAAWAVHYTHPARNREITVVLLDHVPHENNHARGSTRKRDEVDVMWKLGNPLPFDRDRVGRIVLHREKDREGWLPVSVGFSVGGGETGFVFRRSDGTIEEPEEEDGLTSSQRKALDTLRSGFAEKGAGFNEWKRAAKVAGDTLSKAIGRLTILGKIYKEEKRYYPTPELESDPPKDNEEAVQSVQLNRNRTELDRSVQKFSSVRPPYKGRLTELPEPVEPLTERDPIAVFLANPPRDLLRQAEKCAREGGVESRLAIQPARGECRLRGLQNLSWSMRRSAPGGRGLVARDRWALRPPAERAGRSAPSRLPRVLALGAMPSTSCSGSSSRYPSRSGRAGAGGGSLGLARSLLMGIITKSSEDGEYKATRQGGTGNGNKPES